MRFPLCDDFFEHFKAVSVPLGFLQRGIGTFKLQVVRVGLQSVGKGLYLPAFQLRVDHCLKGCRLRLTQPGAKVVVPVFGKLL